MGSIFVLQKPSCLCSRLKCCESSLDFSDSLSVNNTTSAVKTFAPKSFSAAYKMVNAKHSHLTNETAEILNLQKKKKSVSQTQCRVLIMAGIFLHMDAL